MPIPDFIKALRAKVGTELLQVPTVAVVAHDDQGRLLLVQHHESGLWGAPGGIVDPHELPADAAVRETWEEAGVLVELQSLLGVFAGEHFSCTFKNGDRLASVKTVFAGRVVRGMPKPDGVETDHARYFTVEEMNQLSLAKYFEVIYRAMHSPGRSPYFALPTWQPDSP